MGSAFFVEGGAAAASWPPAGRFRGTPACLWVVPRYVPAWVAAGSMAATRNLMAAAASANCAVLVRHACDVPVRASLHVGYWASAWVDRVGLPFLGCQPFVGEMTLRGLVITGVTQPAPPGKGCRLCGGMYAV